MKGAWGGFSVAQPGSLVIPDPSALARRGSPARPAAQVVVVRSALGLSHVNWEPKKCHASVCSSVLCLGHNKDLRTDTGRERHIALRSWIDFVL